MYKIIDNIKGKLQVDVYDYSKNEFECKMMSEEELEIIKQSYWYELIKNNEKVVEHFKYGFYIVIYNSKVYLT